MPNMVDSGARMSTALLIGLGSMFICGSCAHSNEP